MQPPEVNERSQLRRDLLKAILDRVQLGQARQGWETWGFQSIQVAANENLMWAMLGVSHNAATGSSAGKSTRKKQPCKPYFPAFSVRMLVSNGVCTAVIFAVL